MKRGTKAAALLAAVLLTATILPSTARASDAEVDFARLARSLVGARYQPSEYRRLKVIVNKNDLNYYYGLNADFIFDYYPMQLGDGTYKVSVLENTTGSKYRFIKTTDVPFAASDPMIVFRASMKLVNWTLDTGVVQRAFDLTAGMRSDRLKIGAIYDYVVRTYVYDHNKLGNLPDDYSPVLEDLLRSRTGICYDYSAITAAMLRAIGIPAKLVMGYCSGVPGYHAWNEVWLAGEGRWMVIDTTYDAAMLSYGSYYTMEKSAADYSNVSFFY